MASSPRNYVVIVIAVFIAATLLIRTQRSLSDFDIYEGTIEEIKIISIRFSSDKAAVPVLYFTFQGLDDTFGIQENFGDLSVFTNNLKSGDKIKIYYNKHLIEISTDVIHHFVAQLEKDNIALLDLEEANKENKIAGYVLFVAGLIGTGLTVNYYRNNVRGKSLDRTSN